jgi:hypothetical protein
MTEAEIIAALKEKARILYEGKRVGHYSCGIAIAATFNLPTRPYQALRGGGLSGEGPCGAVMAGRLVLGEIFGDPSPTGATAPVLRGAIEHYDAEIARRQTGLERATCNQLTDRFPVFQSEERAASCTAIVALVAEVLAETVLLFGGKIEPTPIPPK